MANDKRTWLITGCSTGFGRELALEALERGEQVVATARKPEAIADIVAKAPDRAIAVQLDVTKPDQIKEAVAAANERFGRIDVLVNNAGWVLVGAMEEPTMEEIKAQFETNFFGFVAMTQAVLPTMRAQRRGHIVNISSMGGISGGLGMSYYGGSKFAMAGVSESMSQEVGPLGIKVTIVEPGGHRTQAVTQATHASRRIDDYVNVQQHRERMKQFGGKEGGSARKAAQAIMTVVDSPEPPLHLPLGADALARLNRKIDLLVTERDKWESLILSTKGEFADV